MEYHAPKSLTNVSTHFCPGCGHGIAHRLVAEVLDELNLAENTLAAAPVGCGVFLYNYFNLDITECAHGRATAVATGMKRTNPDKIVFTYQGDGDLAAIGAGETVNAANRGENITVIFINNAIYGMTGGQMAPTTCEGQITTTSPYGRDPQKEGYPMRMTEMLAQLSGTAYAARGQLNTPANIRKAKTMIKKAFECQINKKGFAVVELLSMCPIGWGVSPQEATKLVDTRMVPIFNPGVIKDFNI